MQQHSDKKQVQYQLAPDADAECDWFECEVLWCDGAALDAQR